MAHSPEDQSNAADNFGYIKNYHLVESSNQSNQKQEKNESNQELPKKEYLLNQPAKLIPQQTIGDCYEVIKSLDREPSITTYLVTNKQNDSNSLLVLELVYDYTDIDEVKSQEDFIQQVTWIKKLTTHVQIPKLLDYVIEQQKYYVVYEYINGEVLSSIMQSRTLNEAEIINLIQDIARIYDFLIKGNRGNCYLLPCNILKSKTNNRYILNNLKELFLSKTVTCKSTLKQQESLFYEQLKFFGSLIIQSLSKQNSSINILKNKVNLNWHQEINFSPKLQNILAKMISSNENYGYHSLPQILQDFEPLLKINQVIGYKYRLIRYLGEKNRIQTYLARQTAISSNNNNLLIVKQLTVYHKAVISGAVLQPQQISNKKIDYLEKEVNKLQNLLDSQEIDFIRENLEDREELYLVRAYNQGESLTKILNQKQNLTALEVIDLLENTLNSLKIVHQKGLIHRNLKPSNIIIATDKKTVSLVDFGLLQTIHSKNSQKVTQYNQGRKPPEQIVGRPTISSDIYSLGIVIIEVLTGLSIKEIPQDSPVGKLIWQEKLMSYPFLIDIVEKMICPDVEKRYQSAEEILQDLRFRQNQKVKQQKQTQYSNNFKISQKLLLAKNKFFKKSKKIVLILTFLTCLFAGLETIFPTIRPQYYVYRGQQQLKNEPAKALISFNQALKLKFNQRLAWQGQGDALTALHHYQSALEAYGQAIILRFNSFDSWQGQGNAYYHLGNLQQALNAYNQALAIQPDNAVALASKGKILYLLSRYQEALPLQEQALAKKSSNDLELISDSALTAIALGKYYQALTQLTRVQDISPFQPYFWQDKAQVLKQLHRTPEAVETVKLVLNNYEQALAQQPEDLRLWLGKAAFLRQWQRYRDALNAYESAIAIDPDSDAAWLGKSRVLLDLKQYSEAKAAIDRVLKIQPRSFLAWHTRGLILQREQQDLDQAVAAYDKAIEINQDFFPSWRDRSLLLIQQNDYETAIQSLQKAVSLAPQDLESWLNLTDALEKMQKIEEAVKAIERAIVLQPRNSKYWLKKGYLWEIKQQYSQACDIYRQAMKIAPDLKISGAMERVGCQ